MTTQEMKEVLKERYTQMVATRESYLKLIDKVYEYTEDKWVEPGIWEVYELDMEGKYSYPEFHFKLEKGMNLKDLALKLMIEQNYRSAWVYLTIREYNPQITIG